MAWTSEDSLKPVGGGGGGGLSCQLKTVQSALHLGSQWALSFPRVYETWHGIDSTRLQVSRNILLEIGNTHVVCGGAGGLGSGLPEVNNVTN